MFGLTFHPYGLLIGIALIVGWELIQRACKKYQVDFAKIQNLLIVILVGGFIFARLWHGVTDWSLYSAHPVALLYVWNGGLSIIGGIIGGMLTAIGVTFIAKQLQPKMQNLTLLMLTDVLVHALPISQAVGRIGNYVNQELYGLPTKLPWGILIDPANRIQSVANKTHFHPLFFYEIILNLGIAIFIWQRHWNIGRGRATAWYFVLYGLGRFLLDFLRIDRGDYVWFNVSLNQCILTLCILVGAVLLGRQNYQVKSAKMGK